MEGAGRSVNQFGRGNPGRSAHVGKGKGKGGKDFAIAKGETAKGRGTGRSGKGAGKLHLFTPTKIGSLNQRVTQPILDLLTNHSEALLVKIQECKNPLILVKRFSVDADAANPTYAKAFSQSESEFISRTTYPSFFVSFEENQFIVQQPADGPAHLFEIKIDELVSQAGADNTEINGVSGPEPIYIMNGRMACVGACALVQVAGDESKFAFVLRDTKTLRNNTEVEVFQSAGGKVKPTDEVETPGASTTFQTQVSILCKAALREFSEEILGLPEAEAERLSIDQIVAFIQEQLGCERPNILVRATANADGSAQAQYFEEKGVLGPEFDEATKSSYDLVIEFSTLKTQDELKAQLAQVKADKRGKPSLVAVKPLSETFDPSRPAQTLRRLINLNITHENQS